MPQISIDVTGQATTRTAPERGVVRAAVTADGPQAQPVKAQVTEIVATLRGRLEDLQEQGAVRAFSIDDVEVRAHRPWNEAGAHLPLVHTASVWVSADFVDFEVLGQWVLTDGLTVSGIEWELDEPTREATERDVRQAALRDAVTRAQDYADAIGAGPVRVTGVREPTVAHPRMMLATAEGGGQVVDIVPEPLEVAAEVQVTFVAG